MSDRREVVCCLLVLVCTAVVYARSLGVPFQFDDYDQVLGNAAVRDPTFARLLDWGRTRIIAYATLALNYRLGGEQVLGYHVVNLGLHLLNTLLVFQLTLTLCATPRLRDSVVARRRLLLATAAAFLFACHPIQVQAVTYISQRVAVLAATFYLASILAYTVARLRRESGAPRAGAYFALAALCAAAAFLTKENTLALPLALLTAEIAFFPGSLRHKLWRLVPFALLVAVLASLWVTLWKDPSRAPALAEMHPLLRILYAAAPQGDVSPLAYFLTQCTVIPRYLGLVVLPWGFNIDHDVAIASGLSVTVVAGLLLLAALCAAGVLALRPWPLVGFAILWFFFALAVESSFLPIADVMMEHRMYLPMVGVALVLASALVALHDRFPRVARGLAVTVGGTLACLTVARNEVWRSELGLWRDALAKSPGKARVHANVGALVHRGGDSEAAIPYYCSALRLDPDLRKARSNLEVALQERLEGMLDENGELDITDNDQIEVRTGKGGEVMIVPRNPCR